MEMLRERYGLSPEDIAEIERIDREAIERGIDPEKLEETKKNLATVDGKPSKTAMKMAYRNRAKQFGGKHNEARAQRTRARIGKRKAARRG